MNDLTIMRLNTATSEQFLIVICPQGIRGRKLQKVYLNLNSSLMPKLRILITSWNAGHLDIAAGGYVRMLEIFKRVPQDVELLIIDTNPGIYRSIKKPNVRHLIYRIPGWLKSLEKISYNLERILEWLIASHRIFWIAARYRQNYDIVFNPYSELLVTSC